MLPSLPAHQPAQRLALKNEPGQVVTAGFYFLVHHLPVDLWLA
jgi:hypothetical protein